MADLEQRRQQYNEMHRQKASAADPGSLKLALQLLNLLPLSDENKAAGADWLARKHKSGTSEDIRTAESLLTAGASMFPPVGIVLEEQAREDALKRGEDPSMLPLMLAMMPMGAGKATGATRAARLLEGAGKALGPAVVIGGPMVLAGTANAGEAGQAEAGQGQPAPGRGDTVRAQYEQQLKMLNQQIETATRRRDEEAQSGYGPKARAADEQLNALMSQQREISDKLANYTSPEESAQAASDREFRRYMMMGGGAGFGVGTAALISYLASKSRGKGVKAFNTLAEEIGTGLKNLPGSPVVGTPAGDELMGLVNEAYKQGGARMPFTRGAGGTMQSRPAEGGIRSALGFGKGESAEDLFSKTSAYGDKAIPLSMLGESAVTTGIGMNSEDPETQALMQDMAAAGLMAAGGYKIARAGAKGMLPKPDPKGSAAVTSARIRLDRELGPARPASAVPEPSPLPGGPLVSLPPDPAIAKPGQAAVEPRMLEPPSTSGDVSSDLPGSLAPADGAKKRVRQPRPKKDDKGRWRLMGEFSPPPSRGKAKTPKGQK